MKLSSRGKLCNFEDVLEINNEIKKDKKRYEPVLGEYPPPPAEDMDLPPGERSLRELIFPI